MPGERPTTISSSLPGAAVRSLHRFAGRPGRAIQPGQERKEVLVAEGLGDEVECPQPHRLDRHGDAAVGGHHDDGHVGQRALLDPLQKLDAVQPRHLQIGNHDVELGRLELRPGLFAVGRGDHFMPCAARSSASVIRLIFSSLTIRIRIFSRDDSVS